MRPLVLFLLIVLAGLGCAPAADSPPLPTRVAAAPAVPIPTSTSTVAPTASPTTTPPATVTPTAVPTATVTPSPTPVPWTAEIEIGRSVLDRPLTAIRFGTGPRPVVFIGGIHGGYEWNTIWLAYKAAGHLAANPQLVPPELVVYIIPAANPDGQFTVTFKDGPIGPADVPADVDTSWGRFNANGVDLNRNWDCFWQPAGRWGERIVSAGEAPFSEPETAALRHFLLSIRPEAVVFWHSAVDAIFPAGCGEIYPPSRELADIYAAASGYSFSPSFTFYEVTGDAADWLATQELPAITVELARHDTLEWEQNLAGMLAVMTAVAEKSVIPPAAAGEE